MRIHELALFLRAWLRNPRQVGALAPSGPALAALMTAQIPGESARVIELGAGTGVFTRELLSRGVAADRLVLVEADPAFAATLRRRFPALRVMNIDAAELGITHGLFGEARASTVVSGLPLVAMPVEQAIAIVHGAFAMHLGPGGAFYQFTYLPRCPIPVRRLAAIGIRAERIGIAWANMPPAAVYRLQRCADFSGSPSSLGRPWPSARPPSTAA